MTRLALRLTAALVAAVFLLILATLPPRPLAASGTVSDAIRARTVAGAVHVHSIRSDGTGDREGIAVAAARAGLQFVIVTDHGDGVRQPDPAAYLHGVLCMDAVEVSTNGGHVIALDMPAAPYPLGGEAAAVVEDINRLGGMAIAAHPDSSKPELAWADDALPLGGIEWLNLDSAWRAATKARVLKAALGALTRAGPAVARVLDRPDGALARWDGATKSRRLVGLAGHDAHGGIGRTEGGGQWALPGPSSYAASFAALSTRVVLEEPLSGDADADAGRILTSLRKGRAFTAIDGLASSAFVDFHGLSNGTEIRMGEERPFTDDAALVFRATAPSDASAVLLRDGASVANATAADLQFRVKEPGAYRVEVRHTSANVPLIVTNPIYFVGREPNGPPPSEDSIRSTTLVDLADVAGVIEKDPGSSATLSQGRGSWTLQLKLREGERVSQYVALAIPLPQGLPDFDSISFDASSLTPLRVSVQLRFESAGGARWRRSVYVDADGESAEVPVSGLVGADRPEPVPTVRTASSLLFVVDLTNALPGSSNQLHLQNLRLSRR
jgi:hypothetical protein